VPIPSAKTEAPLIEPGSAADRPKRTVVPGRNNLLNPGTVLQNRYRVLEIRGVGGMSTVYKARDLRFTSVDRLCAVKEMFNSAEDAKLRQLRLANFQREASLLATLTHASIPRIYDYFEQQGTIYLVLELIHGEDLETLLSQRGQPFEQDQIVDWALTLTSVVAYLHNQRPEPIIFRDLKPSNIMIRNEDGALMLVDFGIARSFAPQQKGTMIGTEGYAPPEQYKGIADARGDIYALGATLHHLATGSDPRSETPFTFAQRPPRRLNPSLTPEFEDLILRCVCYNPDDRPQTAEDIRHTLEKIKFARYAAEIELAPAPKPVQHVEATAADERSRDAGSSLLSDAEVSTRQSAPLVTPAATEAQSPIREVTADPSPVAEALAEKRLDWTLKTGDEIRGGAGFSGGTIYIGSYDGNLYALDQSDGNVRWRFRTQAGVMTKPVTQAEMVIFGSEDKTVYSVSRSSGRAIWTFRTDAAVRSSPLVDEKACIIGSDDGFLYRIDRSRGVVTWRYKTWGPVRSSPYGAGDHVLFGSDDGYLYNVHRDTGNLVWRYQIGAPVMSSPTVADGVVVVGASDGAIRGFNLADGKILWTQETRKTVLASPIIGDGIAYVGSADGHMYAVEIGTGKLAWKHLVCRQITCTAVLDGQALMVGGNDAVFYCLDRASGATQWTFGTGGAIVARPLVTDDHIVFGSLDGSIYALNRG
jgi:serine/threonine protein kinase/outer membrane protein assembly factor BamB